MIETGDRIPDTEITVVTENGQETVGGHELFAGKRAVLFGLPGAFTPVCSASQLPSFVVMADQIKAEGIDFIACLSVNDVFVMRAWAEQQNAGAIMFLADLNAQFTQALGLGEERPDLGGLRSRRYSMIVEDGVVTVLNVERPKKYEVSGAETILEQLRSRS